MTWKNNHHINIFLKNNNFQTKFTDILLNKMMLFNLFLNYIFQQTIQKIRGKKDYSRKCVKNGKNEKKKNA